MAKMCGTLVRICLSTGMKPRSSTATPAFSAPISLPFGLRPTATRILSNISLAGALPPSKCAVSPSGPASTFVTLAFRWIAAYCLEMRL